MPGEGALEKIWQLWNQNKDFRKYLCSMFWSVFFGSVAPLTICAYIIFGSADKYINLALLFTVVLSVIIGRWLYNKVNQYKNKLLETSPLFKYVDVDKQLDDM